ncbi:MAG: GumC family protein [Clostridiales bacterium]
MDLELEKEKKVKVSDYLYVLYKWKKFILINLILVTLIATIISFLLPVTYKSTAVLMIPPDNSMGLGGLAGLIGGGSKSGSAGLGAKLLGGGGANEDVLIGILNSRTALTNVIDKFDLLKYYDVKEKNYDKCLKMFRDDLSFEMNENSMLEVGVVNENPVLASKMANYFVVLLDSLNIKYNVEQAKNNRAFIEKRYFKNLSDLKGAEDSLYRVQKKYGLFTVPAQLEVAVKAAGELEAQLASKEMEAFILKQQYGASSPQYQGLQTQVNLLKGKVLELKKGDKLSEASNVLFPFKEVPDMALQYLRNYREVEIQTKIMEVILPMYEQAKIEEQKSIPAVQVLDKAVPAQVKFHPKRIVIIAPVAFIAFFILILVAFRGEKAYMRTIPQNPLEEKESRFFRGMVRFFRLRF